MGKIGFQLWFSKKSRHLICRDEYGELLNKKDEAFAESRQVTAELETQSATLAELKKKHEEDTTFLAEADTLMADKKKVG